MAALATLGVVALLAFGFRAWHRSGAQERLRFESPDGRFQIVVYRIPTLFAMPGQSGDAPGYFQLHDMRTGRVLRDRSVEMVSIVDRIEWSPTNVSVGMLANWKLPQ